MSQPGMGAMLHYLGGGSPKNPEEYYGRKIADAVFKDSEIKLVFDDGVGIRILDSAQSCCEERYMTCDDNIKDLIGNTLTAIETKEGPETNDGYGEVHEVVFLIIKAGHEEISVATHNEHNGYYGGFGISLDEIK
ncbi:MAG: hypothetical protein DRI46_10440 [Chloroflexi bacterium]|nr:MAG: hypothetical protein DRI46_10440 [Chloroflexota bacterium]